MPSVLVVWPGFGVSLGLLGADEDGGGAAEVDVEDEDDGGGGGGVLRLEVLIGMVFDVLGGKVTLDGADETLLPPLQDPNCALQPLPQ